ncbi:MAG: guanylate kinase [Bacilli bacterium]|nr:guanylate kinase [Bacilli bacterium]
MIKSKKDGLLIVLSGPSGAGKGTICNELLKENNNIWKSVSMTTRLPREGEVDGIDYFYVTEDEFKKRIDDDEFLEYANVYKGLYYGTPKEEVFKRLDNGTDVILEIDIEGAKNVRELMPAAICIFIMPPSMQELKKRLEGRGTETKDKVLERFKKAYQEVNEVTRYNYVIVNDEVSNALKKISAIIEAEKCRVDRIEDVEVGNVEEVIHEELIGLE